MDRRVARLPILALGVALACEETRAPGSLCACLELDGIEECCFGHGVCAEQAQGPRRCECDEGAKGDTCATPPPGVREVRPRTCDDGDDPTCAGPWRQVFVEEFGDCTDLAGLAFASTIVRPSTAEGSWPGEGTWPLAVLVHGASQDRADYYDLLEHLAKNGVVAAAFDATIAGDVTSRANRLLSYLECLGGSWSDAARLDGRVALLGHSRGGAAVAVAAEAIAAGLGAITFEVVAVVALAPSTAEAEPLSIAATPAYLAVQGSRDPDTTGAALGWYDLAGAEVPTRVRSLVWAYGATHQRFHQGLLAAGTGEASAAISGPAHWALARAYVGGFVFWRLLRRDDLRRLFTGEWIPPGIHAAWAPEVPAVFAGLQDGTLFRQLIHDFESDALTPSPTAGDVVVNPALEASVGAFASLDPPWSRGHLTRALRLTATDDTGPASIRFELPDSVVAGVAGEAWALSLRVARIPAAGGDACDPPEEAGPELWLRLVDGAGAEALGLSEVAGPVASPDAFAPVGFGAWSDATCHAVDFLRPVRIPLQRFCDVGVALSTVTALELTLKAPPGVALVVDDLELVRGEGEPGDPCVPRKKIGRVVEE